jgi:hypothetical protein
MQDMTLKMETVLLMLITRPGTHLPITNQDMNKKKHLFKPKDQKNQTIITEEEDIIDL